MGLDTVRKYLGLTCGLFDRVYKDLFMFVFVSAMWITR